MESMSHQLEKASPEGMMLPLAECFKIKVVEPIQQSSRKEREEWLKEANYNMYSLRSDQIFIDLYTDSGTGAMSDKQWGAMMQGDESYIGSRSYYKMAAAIKDILGFDHFLPTHQGRGAENVLQSCIIKEGDVCPGNAHFYTMKFHLDLRKAKAIDCTVDGEVNYDFKGNIDVRKLKQVFETYPKEKIPMVVITVTCNNAADQPVSMSNIKAVSVLANEYGIPVCFDAARFAENAYFIKLREAGYKDKTIKEISMEMFSYADIVSMSMKKDGLCNVGGFLALRDEHLWKEAAAYAVLFEGYITYGGMAGRDMEALAQGLYEGITFEVLDNHIKQVQFLASKLYEYGIPVVKPFGGSAIFIDVKKMLGHIPKKEFRANMLACELYLEAGIRGSAVDALIESVDPVTKELHYPEKEFVRLAMPRRTYTDKHMAYVAAAMRNVQHRCQTMKRGLRLESEIQAMQVIFAKLVKIEADKE